MNAVVERIPAVPAAVTPMDMIAQAVEKGMSIEVISKLMDLQERWQANEARKAFDRALAAAKAEIPIIKKNREVDFTSAKGRTHYHYEDLAGVVGVVDPILARHGLYIRFETKSEPNEPVRVTCIIGHKDGHFISNTLSAGRDDSGNKNHIQQVGSTATYLQRMTLKASLGLAAAHDDDGQAAAEDDTLDSERLSHLQAMIDEVQADKPAFLKYMAKQCGRDLESIADIPASKYRVAVDALNAKRAKA